MAVTEKSGTLKYKDKAGNLYQMLPVTKVANVNGLDTALAGKAAATHVHTKDQISDFPTSMPASDVSAWAKASTKPAYTASEVGAATEEYVDSAIQTAIGDAMEASY